MAKIDYKTMNLDDIIDWCKENNEVDWLKKENAKKPTFIQLKVAFAKKFMPEIMPKAKEKKPSMYDIINAL